MRDLKNKLTSSKNSSNIQPRRGKSFGYQVLGFGAGGSVSPYNIDFLIVAGGGGGGSNRNSGNNYLNGSGGGGGSVIYTTDQEISPGNAITVTVGDGAPGRPNPFVAEQVLGGTSSIASDDFTTVSRTGGGSGINHNNGPGALMDGGGSGGGGNYPAEFGDAGADGGNDGGNAPGVSPYTKGGGGGSGSTTGNNLGGAGGKGIVILRIPAENYSATTTGSPTVTDDGDFKVVKFTGSGSYTA